MKKKITEKVIRELDDLELNSKLEILANVFIELGMSNIDIPQNISVSSANILKVVMDDIDQNGENIANAIVRQGLLILTWLNKEKL